MLEFLDRMDRLERRLRRHLPDPPAPPPPPETLPDPLKLIDVSLLGDATGEKLEPFQREAWQALEGPETNVLIYGGAGSGKTHLWLMWLVLRTLACPAATHAVFRHHFEELKASILEGTLPEVCGAHWPGQTLYQLKDDGRYADFIGGGRIYFGGLDDKERADKVLGQGQSTIVLNEVSRISYGAYLKASTRIRQDRGLPLKLVCDENPPPAGHWTERVWIKGIEPSTGKPLPNPEDYRHVNMHPANNPHLPAATKRRLQNLPARERIRFWDGKFGAKADGQLWTYESIEAMRVTALPPGITLQRVAVAIDPSGCHGPEDQRSDEIGMVGGGLGTDGNVYVQVDESGRYGPGGDDGWGARGIRAWARLDADSIVGEANFGGAMVESTVRSASVTINGREVDGKDVPFHEVSASRGKVVRAEPVSTLCERGRVRFVGHFPELEDQLVQFTTAGYQGDRSPDRADAFVWLCYHLGVVTMAGQGLFNFYAEESAKAQVSPAQRPASVGLAPPVEPAEMLVPSAFAGASMIQCSYRNYHPEAGRIRPDPRDLPQLLELGFTHVSPPTDP